MKPILRPFADNRDSYLRLCGGVLLVLVLATCCATPAWADAFALGTSARLEGPTAGLDSVVLAVTPETGTWTAMADAPWLHLDAANQNGTGSTNVIFSYDANPGTTRMGTLTIAGQTLTITQAGASYAAATPVVPLVSSGLNTPLGVAVDRTGNVYIADLNIPAIKQWTAANNTVTNLVSLPFGASPLGVAVDGASNVYIVDYGLDIFNPAGGIMKKWTAANDTVTDLVISYSTSFYAVAVDGVGNVYIANYGSNAITMWRAADNTVIPLVSSGLSQPSGVAVDRAGNVYFSDTGHNAIKKWTAANNTVTDLVSSGLDQPFGVAVDGAGNVFFTDSQKLKKWTAASNSVTTLDPAGLDVPAGVAVDDAGNLYVAAMLDAAVEELPRAFVDPTAKLESAAAGSDVLPAVLPTTANLLPPFAPTSDQPWLTITGITNGVVSFALTANVGASSRTANITLLGQSIPVAQAAPITPPTLIGATMLGNNVLQFAFSNNTPGATFTVLSTTNVSLPLSDWTVVGPATNTTPGLFQFTTPPTTNDPQRFYRVRSPYGAPRLPRPYLTQPAAIRPFSE